MLLVHFEPMSLCGVHHTGLLISPLPSKKLLWEARDESLWKAEIEREPDSESKFALAANGGLVRLDDGGHGQPCGEDLVQLHKPVDAGMMGTRPRTPANWGEWFSGMDEFGGLVMLAASLTG